MALFECKSKLLSRFGLLVCEHENAALKVRQLDPPAHREHVLGEV